MAYALISGSDIEAKSSDGNGFTSAAIDTTGATLLVVGLTYFFVGANGATLTDSKGNSWTSLTEVSDANHHARLFYSASPTVGSGHTFTLPEGSTFGTMFISAWSGNHASPADQENTNFAISASTIQPGSITPTEANELVVTVVGGSTDTVNPGSSIDGGYTITGSFANTAAVNVGGAMAYLIQGSAAATNPTWTASAEAVSLVAVIASFKSGGGAAPFRAIPRQMGVRRIA